MSENLYEKLAAFLEEVRANVKSIVEHISALEAIICDATLLHTELRCLQDEEYDKIQKEI